MTAAPVTVRRVAAPDGEPDHLQSVLARCVTARAGGVVALLQRKISFASYVSEAFGWYPEVPAAVKDFESLKQELQQLNTADVPGEIRSWLTAESRKAAAFVATWDETKSVPTSDRTKVIAKISKHRNTLATLSGQIATKKSEIAEREREAAEKRQREEKERVEQERALKEQQRIERERLAEEQRVKDERVKEEQRLRALEMQRAKQEQAQQAHEKSERDKAERAAELRRALEKELAGLSATYGPQAVARRQAIRREMRDRAAAAEDELTKEAQAKRMTQMTERHKGELKNLKSKARKSVKARHTNEEREEQEASANLRAEARGRREEQARADERAELLVQIGHVEPEVERLLAVLDKFDTDEGLALAAEHAAAARGAAGAARAVIAEDVSAAGSELKTATAAVASLADSVAQAGVKRATVKRRRDAVEASSRKLIKRWPPRKHLTKRLAAHDRLTPAQQIAGLTDDAVVGGIAMLEFEIESATEVDRELRAISRRVEALKDTGVFMTWATATAKALLALEWEDLARSMDDEEVPSGIAALRLGLVQSERLRSIGKDIAALKLPVLRDELLSHADRPPPDSWRLQVEGLAELEQELADAQDVDRRRDGAEKALVGATLDTNQRSNIVKWLEDNAKLSLANQRNGIASEYEAVGLKKIQTAIARYNSAYQGTQQAEAEAEAARREAQRLRDRSTSHLISGSTTLLQLHDEGLIEKGRLVETFRSNYDTEQGEFSVEYTVEGLNNILVHAHCEADGTPKAGNAVHWKERRHKYVVGYARHFPDALRAVLLDDAAELKNNRDRNPKINTL